MPTTVQFRRGTTAQNNAFTGAVGEITVDTTDDRLVVHDGTNAGGSRAALASETIFKVSGDDSVGLYLQGGTDVLQISGGNGISTSTASTGVLTIAMDGDITTVNSISSADSTGIVINDNLIIAGTIKSDDSTALQIDEAVNISGALFANGAFNTNSTITSGAITSSGSVTSGASFIIGSADIDETDLEKIDGITNGAGAANKALVLDGSANVASGLAALTASGVITAAGFTIGSAAIVEAELETIDGVTAGTVAASKAVVVDSDKDIGSFRNVTATGSFIIGSADMNETDLEKLDGITNGTAAANKALVADANIDIDTIRNLGMTGNIEVGGDAQIGGNLTVSGTTTSVNTTSLEVADALIELNKTNSGGADVDAGIFIQRGSAGNNAVFYWNEGDDSFKTVLSESVATATSVTDSSFAGLEVGSLTVNAGVGITASSGDVTVANSTSDKDLIFTVNDGGAATEVFRLDGDVSALKIAASKQLQLGAAEESISGDGTDITFAVGAGGDINIPASIGITFGDDGEKIEGDGTDLTITGNNINLTAAAAVVVPSGIPIQFVDANEKIASDGTDLTINSGAKINLSATTDVHIPTSVGLVFGAGEKIEGDDTNLTLTSGGTIIADCTSLVTTTLDVNIIQSTDSAEILINEALRVTGTITGTVTSAQYADLAEIFPTDETDLESGDVVHFTGNKKVGKCNEDAHSSVAGVISTEPGFLLNEGAVGVKLAMTGRVPCKVTGTINPGDLLVSAGNGRARAEANPSIGTVIGKALESKDTAGDAVIDIMITMM